VERPTIRLLALLLILRVGHATTPALLQAQTIWVEGEKPARSTMSRHPWWYDQVNLTRGRHTISFRMSSENHHHGALDAFVFTTKPFLPSGTTRQGETNGVLRTGAGTWPFLPERDTFSPEAMFDLRDLNEKVAGQNGFVRLSPDGESFVLGVGSPVRFWGVTTYVQRDRSAEDLAHHARFLAKRGVNMVRLHGELESKDKGANLTDVDQKTIDEAWKLVAAMKKGFCTGESEWSSTDRSDWDAASRQKWSVTTPMVMGQFPAAALAFRKGYITQGEPVVVEHRSLQQLWGRVLPLISEDPSYDPNRDRGDLARRSAVRTSVDPLAFLVGPVKVVYGSDPSKTRVVDLKRFIDHKKNVVRSVTGQITWNHGEGICTIDAPRVQGASGFLKKTSPIKLKDVTIQASNDYATVLVVALDNQPLNKSKRVLVQIGTTARPTGWIERETTFQGDDGKQTYHGKQVVDTGKMPWAIADAQITLTVANPGLTAATQLDINGNPRAKLKTTAQSQTVRLQLPKDALYVVLEAK
jgi:hypothetical protein